MPWMSWASVGLGGLLSGAALVGVLALRRSAEPLMLLACLAGTAVAANGLIGVITSYARPGVTLLTILLGLGCSAGGYGLASSALPSVATRQQDVSLDGISAEPEDSRPLVLVVAAVEPPIYEPSVLADELVDLQASGMPQATIGVTPFLFAAAKTRYRAAGGRSPSLPQARALTERLESVLPADQYAGVSLVTLIGRDRLDFAVERAARSGHRRFIIVNQAAAESHEWERAREELDLLRPEDHRLSVVHTTPLWSEESLADMLVRRTARFAPAPDTTGVALVLHGQSDLRVRRQPQYEVQENSFANRVRMGLVEHGLGEANVRLCYAEWGTPDITETVRHIAALGATRILVCPVCYPFESIATVLDISVAIRQARVSPHVYTTTLTAWGDDPVVADTLATVVRQAHNELP